MHDAILSSGWDTFLVAIPLILLLFFGFFRLDEVFTTPQRTLKRRPACGTDEEGEPILSDPDGRLLGTHILAGNQVGTHARRSFAFQGSCATRESHKPSLDEAYISLIYKMLCAMRDAPSQAPPQAAKARKNC